MIKSIFAILFAMILVLPIVEASEWSLTATLNPSLKYDDNIFMSENDPTSSVKYAISPTAIIQREQANSNASLNFGYVLNRYKTLRNLNTDDPFIRFNSGYQTERSNWGLSASFKESSSRSSAAEDTGDFTTESTVTTETLSPSFSYQVTERDSIFINSGYSQRTYSTTDFSDSESLSLTTGWQHQFTERFNGGLNVSVTESESKGLASSTENTNYNLSTSLNYELSELWSMGGNIGVRRSESKQKNSLGITSNNNGSGLSFNLSASRQTETDTLSMSTSRSVSASSSGGVNETTLLSLSWSRELSEKVTSSMAVSYQLTTSATDQSDDKRENFNFSPAIQWRLDPNLGLNFAYNFRQQKQSNGGSDASGNGLTITLNYDWDGIRVSR